MKRWLIALLPLCGFAEHPPEPETWSYWDIHPIHVGAQGLYNSTADASHVRGRDPHPRGGHVLFNKSSGNINVLVPISRETFFIPRVEYNYITFYWSKNPYFRQRHFQYLQFGITAYTKALNDWRWIGRFDYNIDPTKFDIPGPYSLYSWLLWGRYEINKQWAYHIGTVGASGMRQTNVYPLFGLDYAPNSHWLIEAIFPINYAVNYKPTDRWTVYLKGRPMKERVRTGDDEVQPRSIVRYSSLGAEVGAQYEIPMRFKIEAYGGLNTGGSFYIKDMHGHRALYGDIGLSAYVGGAFDFGF